MFVCVFGLYTHMLHRGTCVCLEARDGCYFRHPAILFYKQPPNYCGVLGAVYVHTLCMRVLIPRVYVEGRKGHPCLPLLFLALIFSGGVFLVEHGTCGLIIVV